LAALLVSMTGGAIVLMVLSGKPPVAGPFSLSSYIGLDPIKQATRSRTAQHENRWDSIEIHYSATQAGNIEQLASLSGLADPGDLNCHFVVCNGVGGKNGQVLSTERWQRQWSISPSRAWQGRGQAIRICIIADGTTTRPTDYQIKRVDTLIDKLRQTFSIRAKAVRYPQDWQ